MAHFEISPKVYQVRVYENAGDMAYKASYHLYVDGDRGQLWGLIGRDYYRDVPAMIEDMFKQTGVKEVEASVSEEHALLIEAKLKGHCKVERIRAAEHSGRPMVLIRLSI